MQLRTLVPLTAIALLAAGSLVLAQSRGHGQGQGQPPRGPGGPFSVDRLMQNDADGDGKLSREELPARFAERFFDEIDANKDGALERVEIEAFFTERAAGRRERGRDAESGPSFERNMRTAGRSLRRLSRSAFDADSREADLETVSDLQLAFVGAKRQLGTVPMSENGKATYGDDEAAYRTAFRLQLLAALTESIALESAVIAGDADGARASVGKLDAIRKKAHAAFQPDDDDEDEAAEGGEGEGRRR